MQEMQVQLLNWEDPLEEEMAAHSSILAWKIPWTKEPAVNEIPKIQTWLSNWTYTHSYWCINIYKFYTLLMDWPTSSLCNSLLCFLLVFVLKSIFVWYEYWYPSYFFLFSWNMFSIFSLQSLCFFISNKSILEAAFNESFFKNSFCCPYYF